jgi:hypothetical protein
MRFFIYFCILLQFVYMINANNNNNGGSWNKKALATSKATAKPVVNANKPNQMSTTNKNGILVKSNKTTSKMLNNSLELTSSTSLSSNNKKINNDFSVLFRRFIKSIIDWANEDV